MSRLALVLAMALVGCSRTTRFIHLEIPDGYTGSIIFAEVEGYSKSFVVEDGRYLYSIPENGVLCVSSYEPFKAPFVVTAEYKSGGKIYSSFQGQIPPPDANSVRLEVIGQRSASIHEAGGEKPKNFALELWLSVGPESQIEASKSQWQSLREGFDEGQCDAA